MIDNYRKALGDSPEPLIDAIETWPSSTGLMGWAALGRISELLSEVRNLKLTVIHVTALTQSESGVVPWTIATKFWQEPDDGSLQQEDRMRRAADIVNEASPIPGEVVLKKSAPSAFFGTPLAGHLISLGIDTLVIGGEATSGCVRATVVDAASYRFKVTVIEECVYDSYESSHAVNLFDMHRKYADVVPLKEVLSRLRQTYGPS
jgi:nicotinamidase-related amidase